MKNLFAHLTAIVILSSFILPQDFTLRLCLENKAYLKGEQIIASAELINNSSPVKMSTLQSGSQVDLIFMDSMKTLLGDPAAWVAPENDKAVEFKTGDTMTAICFVTDTYSNIHEPGVSLFERTSLKPGKYHLQFKYKYYNPAGSYKEIYSDIVELRIVEPQSEADKIVYETLTKENAVYSFGEPKEVRIKYADILLDLVKRYPESGYFPSAYFNLFYTLDVDEFKRIDALIEESMVKYPDSIVNCFLAEAYFRNRRDVFSTKSFYSKLSHKARKHLKGMYIYSKGIKEVESKIR